MSMAGMKALFSEQKLWMERQFTNMKAEVKEELRGEFMSEMTAERKARAELEDKVKVLTSKLDAFIEADGSGSRSQGAKLRSSSWSPLDTEYTACVGGFKPFSHATEVKKLRRRICLTYPYRRFS